MRWPSWASSIRTRRTPELEAGLVVSVEVRVTIGKIPGALLDFNGETRREPTCLALAHSTVTTLVRPDEALQWSRQVAQGNRNGSSRRLPVAGMASGVAVTQRAPLNGLRREWSRRPSTKRSRGRVIAPTVFAGPMLPLACGVRGTATQTR